MARERIEELQQHQAQLLARSATLRAALSLQAQALQRPLKLADQTYAGLQWLRRHPLWPLVGVLVLLLAKPKRALSWVPRLWWAWRWFKKAQAWLAFSGTP